MRAAVIRQQGAEPVLGDFADPGAAGAGQVVIAVEAAGLNPADLALANGTYYVPTPADPYVPGVEGVGVVQSSGDEAFPVGTRVYVDLPAIPHGTLAERAKAFTASASPIPEDLDAGLACAVGIAGTAALLSLDHRAHLQAGETVLILGATGVVGQVAVKMAKKLRAARAVAAGRDPERLEAARALGADATVVLGGQDVAALAGALREAAEGAIDVVLDPLAGVPSQAAMEAMAIGGRLVQMGRAASETIELSSATVRGKVLSVVGHTNLFTAPDAKRAAYQRLAGLAAQDRLKIDVESYGLDRIAEAWQRQDRAGGRKVVVTP